jgi:hypothetical protein
MDEGTNYDDGMRRISWELKSVNAYLDELHRFWATSFGISGPQWTISSAIVELDTSDGVPVNAVSKMLC